MSTPTPKANSAVLETANITVRADHHPIVDDASLMISPGELVGLIGPNGAGKSSLLRALANLCPFTGTLSLAGKAFSDFSRRKQAQTLAYLPQERHVEWDLPAREIVALGRHPHRSGFASLSAKDHEIIEDAITAVDAGEFAHRPINTLSGGEKARILLARALAVEAPLLLVDEPIAALDPYHQLLVMEVLQEKAKQGAGVLAVFHELTLASRFLDRLIIMHKGKIIADGPPDKVLSPEIISSAYDIEILTGEFENQRWIMPWKRKETPAN